MMKREAYDLRVSLIAIVVAMCGLPIYMLIPHFAHSELGISLSLLGAILLVLRVIDMIQDIWIGKAIDHWIKHAKAIAMIAAVLVFIGLIGVLSIRSDFAQILILIISSLLLVTGYSVLYILLYRFTSLSLSDQSNREISLQIGVMIGAALPFFLASIPYVTSFGASRVLGVFLGSIMLLVVLTTLPIWSRESASFEKMVPIDRNAKLLLTLFFLNALPVAITATLFFFFVEERLSLREYAQGLILLFFICTIIGVWLGYYLYEKLDTRNLLATAMLGSVFSFFWAFWLGANALYAFALICIASGILLGFELYLLPVILSRYLRKNGIALGASFGIWSFLNKLALGIGAIALLPVLEWVGFESGASNTTFALTILAAFYALIPSAIKMISILVLFIIPKEVFR